MVSSQSVTDSVASIQQSENAVELKESGICEISPFYLSVRPKLLEQIGFDGDMTFRLDCLGKIAHIDKLDVYKRQSFFRKADIAQTLRSLLEYFGKKDSCVLDYWIDNSLQSDFKKPSKNLYGGRMWCVRISHFIKVWTLKKLPVLSAISAKNIVSFIGNPLCGSTRMFSREFMKIKTACVNHMTAL